MKTISLSTSLLFAASISLLAEDWARFRGPNADGTTSDKPLPTAWSDKKNMVWRTKLPGPGSSSPIVSGNKIFLTSYSGYGTDLKAPGDVTKLKRHALCLDRATGKILWQHEVKTDIAEKLYNGQYITSHGYASSSAVTDGTSVFFFFAHVGVHAYSVDGKKVWEANVGEKPHDWGAGSSPILYGDLLIVNAALESDTLFALDRRTGKEVWSVRGFPASWNTPVIMKLKDGYEEMIVNASGKLRAFNPKTGEELWNCQSIRAAELCPSVLVHDEIIYVIGSPNGQAIAVRAGGKGDVSQSHVVWKAQKGSNVGSPVYHEGHLYFVNDSRGTATCLRADTGEVVYEQPMSAKRDRWYASPILNQGKLYFVSRTSGTVILAAKPQFESLATNVIEGDTSVFNASPAAADGRLYLRSDEYAYCIGEK